MKQCDYGVFAAKILSAFFFSYFLLLVYFGSANFFITIKSDSMHPAIDRGDVVFIKNEPYYAKGDTIAFVVNGEIFVHRITSISAEGYRTKGDNVPYGDFWVVENGGVLGKVVFRIPLVGYPALWLMGLNPMQTGKPKGPG